MCGHAWHDRMPVVGAPAYEVLQNLVWIKYSIGSTSMICCPSINPRPLLFFIVPSAVVPHLTSLSLPFLLLYPAHNRRDGGKSVCFAVGKPGVHFLSRVQKTLKNGIRSFPAWRSAQ